MASIAAIVAAHNRPLLLATPPSCATIPKRYYVYVGHVMTHEFGHTFGLPDFYADNTGLQGLPAVMDNNHVNQMITTEDIKQLRAIYAIHDSTNH